MALDYHSIALFADEALRRKDPYNHHGLNVSLLSMEMLPHIGLALNSHETQMLMYGAWMHDIGKLFLTDDLLNATRRLTVGEKERVKTHAYQGWSFGSALGFDPIIQSIVYCHHEAYDGTGYPRGLSGDDIPPLARLVHVADVYDACTNERAYRLAMTKEEALDTMDNKMKGQFDPLMMEALHEVVEKNGRFSRKHGTISKIEGEKNEKD